MVEVGVMHGMVIGLTVLIAVAVGLMLARTLRTWIADDAHAVVLEGSRRSFGLVIAGTLIAALGGLALPVGEVLTTPADHIGAALLLGSVAGATPFLVHTDIVVRRLPDRIVWPLIGIGVVTAVLASVLGGTSVWFLVLFAGIIATIFFAGVHLLGRVMNARTMGLGDVKLAFVVFSTAALFQPFAAVLVLVAMMLISGIWALFGAIRAGRVRGVTIAFGPAMLSGMWLGCLFGPILL
ncbi:MULTISPECIES: prepilin peptidase [unclassified Brevibacterium]|uniref:prepilin peptidase n=1 Tax=unclassified Brevibacterium TaxID=2614124 RepID=UPI0010924356|nr:prepilin peptidase [Brevibacterium sp. S22]TGD32397.1 hypothetical protein EB835_05035 [Brevibacterium sp. S22]